MHKIQFIGALLFLGLAACNDGGGKTQTDAVAEDSSQNAALVAGEHQHTVDSSQLNNALPAVPDSAKIFFVNLKDGQTIQSPFKVEMGISGIGLDSAGAIRQASGHHHILLDAGDSLSAGTVVPKDSLHLHFGNAQKEAEIKLAPGKHRITLQYADGIHRSYGSRLATSVSVTVK
jgi:hypothetical protein